METLHKFKSGTHHVLIATDVAARGPDIKSIKSVVNFDIARDMDMHVHRIGRTGRVGDKDGTAHTLITQKEARFAGELVNSLIAAGQNVSAELMDLAMKDGRFRSKREARKGGGKKGKARGGAGRGVRGVDFGLGIGYNTEPNSISSPSVPSRSVAVNTIRTGVMAQFKSNFVADSSTSSNQGLNNSSSLYANKRPALRGFVSGGTIGGDANVTRTTSSFTPAPVSGGNSTVQNSRENLNQNYSQSLRDRPRERWKPSGWDR